MKEELDETLGPLGFAFWGGLSEDWRIRQLGRGETTTTGICPAILTFVLVSISGATKSKSRGHPRSLCFKSPRLDAYVSFKPTSSSKLNWRECSCGTAPAASLDQRLLSGFPFIKFINHLQLKALLQFEPFLQLRAASALSTFTKWWNLAVYRDQCRVSRGSKFSPIVSSFSFGASSSPPIRALL